MYSVVSEKSSCRTGRASRPPPTFPVFDQYCLLCALTPRCRCGRVLSNSTVSLFVLHCWKVYKSQTLYDEFWINLSFGRLLPSSALLEWWTDCVGLYLMTAGLFISNTLLCVWVIEFVVNLHRLQVPFISFLLLSNISSEHDYHAATGALLSVCFSKAAALSQRSWHCGLGNLTTDDPTSTHFTTPSDSRRSQSLNSFFFFETGPRTETGLHVIIPGEKKIQVEGPSRNGQSGDDEK